MGLALLLQMTVAQSGSKSGSCLAIVPKSGSPTRHDARQGRRFSG
jgi:hypothetical protein